MSDATVGKHRQEDDAEKGLSRTTSGYGGFAAGAVDLLWQVQEYRLAWPQADRFVHRNGSWCKPVESDALGTEGMEFNADSNPCSHLENI